MNKIRYYAKAVAAFVVAVAAQLGIDGTTKLSELWPKLLAAVLVAAGVYIVPNKTLEG